MPANLLKTKYKEVLVLAKKAHEALACRGVTRSDFKFKDNKEFSDTKIFNSLSQSNSSAILFNPRFLLTSIRLCD